jgi:hypothetical protein
VRDVGPAQDKSPAAGLTGGALAGHLRPGNGAPGLWLGPALLLGIDGKNPKWCTATIAVRIILEFAMNDVVELILNTYQSMRPLDIEQAADSRQKISRYINTLASAGQRDVEQLTIYGLAYLTELHEGQDPQFTGC